MVILIQIGFVLFALLLSVALAGVPMIFLLFVLANRDMNATSVPEGTMRFVVSGEDWHKTLTNVDGYHLSNDGVFFADNDPQNPLMPKPWHKKFLEEYGIWWVSFLWPYRHIHGFKISADKLIDTKDVPADSRMRDYIRHEERLIHELRFRFPRPVLVENVELGGDRWQVDILIMLDLEVVRPFIPVFMYKGKFFPLIDAAVQGVVMDLCRGKKVTYSKFTAMKKSGDAAFCKNILKVNRSAVNAPIGIGEAFGIKIRKAWVSAFELSPKQDGIVKAAKAKEEAIQLANAKVEEAKGIRKAKEEIAAGDGAKVRIPVSQLINLGVDPNVATDAVRTVQEAEALGGKESKITTLVQRGGVSGVIPTIPLTSPTTNKGP